MHHTHTHTHCACVMQTPAIDQRLTFYNLNFWTWLLVHKILMQYTIPTQTFLFSAKYGDPNATKLTVGSWLRNISLSTLLTLLMALMYKPRIK